MIEHRRLPFAHLGERSNGRMRGPIQEVGRSGLVRAESGSKRRGSLVAERRMRTRGFAVRVRDVAKRRSQKTFCVGLPGAM